MSEDRIRGPEDAEMREQMDALLNKVGTRQRELLDALATAGTDYDECSSIVDSMSESECQAMLTLKALEVANLWAQLSDRVDSLYLAPWHATGDGPFTFQTMDELARIVRLGVRIVLGEMRPDYSPEATEPLRDEIAELIDVSENLAAEKDITKRFKALAVMGSWKLGRRTHGAVVPIDFPSKEVPSGYPILCGRGEGLLEPFPTSLHLIDCPGCRNALLLGGFVQPDD